MILLSSLGFGTIVFEFVMLILLLALVYKLYQRESSKLGTLDDMMKTGSLTFFKFLGSITTGLEVINLTISAVYNEVMGPFSASTRYLTIGYLEVFFTFMYIRFCYKAVEDNEVWLLSKPKLIQGLFKIWVAIKYSPLFFLAFSVTAGISILYLENTGSLVMESTGKELFPYIWEAVSIKTVKSPDLSFIEAISKEVLSSLPQLSAFGLIYFTPFITLTMVILLILLPTKSTIEMLKREGLYGDDKKKVDSESDKKSEEKKETTGRRSRSRERSSGTERSRTTSDKDTDKKEEEDDGGDDGKKSEGDGPASDIIHTVSLSRYLKYMNESFADHSFQIDIDEYMDRVFAVCGISEDGKIAKIRNHYTAEDVESYINSLGKKGVSPADYYKENILPIVKGSTDMMESSNGIPNGYLGVHSIKEEYAKYKSEMDDLKTALEVATRQYNENKSSDNRDEFQKATDALNAYKPKFDEAVATYNKKLQQIIVHFKQMSNVVLNLDL